MKISAKKLAKQKRNQAMYSKYITLTEEGIVDQVIYVKGDKGPKNADNCYKIPKDLEIEAGDKVKVSGSEIKVIKGKEENKKSWWKFG